MAMYAIEALRTTLVEAGVVDHIFSVLDACHQFRWWILACVAVLYLRARQDLLYMAADHLGIAFLLDWIPWPSSDEKPIDIPPLEYDSDSDESAPAVESSVTSAKSTGTVVETADDGSQQADSHANNAGNRRSTGCSATNRVRMIVPQLKKPPGWLVYDPVFGAVPEEVLGRWKQCDAQQGQEQKGRVGRGVER